MTSFITSQISSQHELIILVLIQAVCVSLMAIMPTAAMKCNSSVSTVTSSPLLFLSYLILITLVRMA